MTETVFASSPRLERPTEGGFKGVCAALARTTGTDLVLWRVLFVVLTLFGGLGIVLYLVGIVMIPEEGEAHSIGDRLLHGPDRHLQRNSLILVVITVVSVIGLAKDSNGIIIAAVAAALGLLWWRTHGTVQPADITTTPSATAAQPLVAPEPPIERKPVRRSPFVGLTASLAVLTAGILVLIGATGTSIPAEVVLASSLAVVGLGLVVGSFFGRSTGLVLLTLVLGLALAVTAAVRPAIEAGLGDRTWTPGGSASYRLGVGDATLDLRDLPLREAQTYKIDARVDVGHLLVLVPETARVSLDARAQLGDVEVFGVESNGRHAHRQFDSEGRPQVTMDLSVRTGQVEVRRG